MSTAAKIIIGIVIVIVLFIVAVIGAGAYWWTRSGRQMVQSAVSTAKEGADFGKTVDNQKCVDESVARYKKEPGIGGTIQSSMFMATCLQESEPTPGFCDSVPTRLQFVESAKWQLRQAEKYGIKDDNGGHLFTTIQNFCEQQKVKREATQGN